MQICNIAMDMEKGRTDQ